MSSNFLTRPSNGPQTSRRPGALYAAAGIAVFVLGLVALNAGAEVSQRDLSDAGLLTRAYLSLSLFVMGGGDLGVPSGGPRPAQALLWVCYFAAPAVTVLTLIEGFVRSFASQARERLRLEDHIVIVGQGRLGRLYQEVVNRLEPERVVVVVDEQAPTGPSGRRAHRFVQGDVRDPGMQGRLQLDRAAAVMLLTDDDLLNLDAAAAVAESVPRLSNRLVIHLNDIGLKRLVMAARAPNVTENSTRTVFYEMGEGADGSDSTALLETSRDQLINSQRIAARHLVMLELLPNFAETAGDDIVFIAGFGDFGQAILEILQREAKGRFDTVVVVDPKAPVRIRNFDDQVGIESGAYTLRTVAGDLEDPATWAEATQNLTARLEDHATVIIGTPAEDRNIRLALWLDQSLPNAHIVLRCFRDSVFTRRLANRRGFHVCSEGDLLVHSLEERHRRWFKAKR